MAVVNDRVELAFAAVSLFDQYSEKTETPMKSMKEAFLTAQVSLIIVSKNNITLPKSLLENMEKGLEELYLPEIIAAKKAEIL